MAKSKTHASSEKMSLAVEKREVFGKKLKTLRRTGAIPANVFGTGFKSEAVSVQQKEFYPVYRVAQETGVVYLTGLKTELPVLIQRVQKHPVNDVILHVDFRKVDLTKKIETEVPVVFVGQSEAVAQKGGVLLQAAKTLKVEALPQDIPHEISVDISVFKEVGQELKVADLPKSSAFEIKEDVALVVASVVAHKEESVTPETTAAAAPEVITEAKAEEGEAIAEGAPAAQPAAEKKDQAPAPKQEEKKAS